MKMQINLGQNPYHDESGKFSVPHVIQQRERGSRTRPSKSRALVQEDELRWDWTPYICGRKARRQGRNIRCWDGRELVGKGEWRPIPRGELDAALAELTSGRFTIGEKVSIGIFGSILTIQAIRLIADWRAGRL